MSQRCVLSPTSGPSAWRLTSEGGAAPRALALKASGLQWELPGPGTDSALGEHVAVTYAKTDAGQSTGTPEEPRLNRPQGLGVSPGEADVRGG